MAFMAPLLALIHFQRKSFGRMLKHVTDSAVEAIEKNAEDTKGVRRVRLGRARETTSVVPVCG